MNGLNTTRTGTPLRHRGIGAWWMLASLLWTPLAALAAPPVLTAQGSSVDLVTPIHVGLALDRLAGVGQVVSVTCTITADEDAPGTQASIELPANVRRVGGELSWSGDLRQHETVSFSAKLLFDAPGNTTIRARALRRIDAHNSWGDLAALYLTVGTQSSRAGFAPIPDASHVEDAGMSHPPTGILLPAQPAAARRGSAAPTPPAHEAIPGDPAAQTTTDCKDDDEKPGTHEPPPCAYFAHVPRPDRDEAHTGVTAAPVTPQGSLTVTGHWYYYDRDDAYTPAIEFLVELVRGDNSAHLAWCFTDLAGAYSCGPVDNPGGVGVRTRLYSWTNYNPNPDTLAVVNPDWGTSNDTANAYKTRTGVVVLADGVQDIGSWHSNNGSNYERAYWTLRDVIDVWRYVHFNGGGGEAGPTTVEWKLDGTHGDEYHPGGNVHITGETPLAPKGTVTKHEYGHNIMYNVYAGYMPPNPSCNPHTIQGSYSAGCAWTEGWAEFLPAVVNNDPHYYWANGAQLNLETPSWGTSGWSSGDWVEGRVAGALWDMFDAASDGDDTYSDGGFANFWDVMRNVRSDTFSHWWSSWLGRGHSNVSWGPIMGLYQNTIEYRTGPANDDFANRHTIPYLPFVVSGLDTRNATTQGLDPALPCASVAYPRQSRSVWYAYTPTVTDLYKVDTIGSSHDTVLALWRGSWGGLANRGCNDDAGGLTSSLTRTLYAGVTYYIEAMAYGSGAGGTLSLTMSRQPNDRIFSDGFTGDQ